MRLYLFVFFLFYALNLSGINLSDAKELTVSHPSYSELEKLIKEGQSIISKKGRQALSTITGEMDQYNQQLLQKSGFKINDMQNVAEKLLIETRHLPKYTPKAERALLYSLHTQIDMLDNCLLVKDPERAQRLRVARQNRKIIDPGEFIFRDIRDKVIREYIENMKHIYELQKALGASGACELGFPVQLKTLDEVERYFEAKMIILTKLSKSLL